MYAQTELLVKENGLKKQLMELRDTQSRVQQKLETKEKEKQDSQKSLVNISKQLSRIGSSGAAIEEIEKQLRKNVWTSSYCKLLVYLIRHLH